MGKGRKLSLDNKRIYKIVIFVFGIICLIMGILCYRYYLHLQTTVKTESNDYLKEISKHIAENVSKTIDDNFSLLSTISLVLKNTQVMSFEKLQPVVKEQQHYWNYQNIFLIDENGIAYDANGKTVVLNSDDYLRTVLVNKKPAMSTSQIINDKECIIFAIPLSNMVINTTEMHALAASYDLETFDQILSMSAFNNQGYTHIIQKDGSAIVRSSSDAAPETGYNILNSLFDAQISDGNSLEKIKKDISEGISGQATLTQDGVANYMIYTPLKNNQWCLLTFVPVNVVNEKSELLLKITLLLCSFITLSFALLFSFLMLSFYHHKQKLEQIAYVDSITKGHTIDRFYQLAKEALNAPDKLKYALIFTNIEKFKVLNEQFGRNYCNEILRAVQNAIESHLHSKECMGRLFADNFCILIEYENTPLLPKRFEEWYQDTANIITKNKTPLLPLIMEFGIYIIDNDTIPFPHMIDRAKLSLKESTWKTHSKLRYAVYDEKMRNQLFREKQLEDMMETALLKREFQVYLQPKYHTQNESIGGAEALVRWISHSEGMIFPNEFIALFEKNGFIIALDLFVFEEVCSLLNHWLKEGLKPIKISINCSTLHLKRPDFLKDYCTVFERYDIPAHFIEIELTENVVFDDVEGLIQIINDIHAIGFTCSLDDFGSGYSSLNIIQNIPVDTLKLDKIFFCNASKNLKRTESVINSILMMARSLSMETVAEGVEERFHVDMLKRIGCDYIQGFFFAKPMPISEFEQLAFGKSFDKKKEASSQ